MLFLSPGHVFARDTGEGEGPMGHCRATAGPLQGRLMGLVLVSPLSRSQAAACLQRGGGHRPGPAGQ